MKKLLIIGAGGQGKVVLDCALANGTYSNISFLSNDPSVKQIAGHTIYYEQEILSLPQKDNDICSVFFKDYDEVIVAIGNNNTRLKKTLQFAENGIKLATLIHPEAVVSRFSEILRGSVVFAKAVVNPFSSIGMACIINTGVIVEHDCTIGDGVHISSGAVLAGNVSIDKESWVCIGCRIANNIKIGSNSVIGAGGVVLHNIPDRVLAAGIPAEIKKKYD